METVEDCGMRLIGYLNPENSILDMDRRRLHRELRRVVRVARADLLLFRRHAPGTKELGHRTDWWMMVRRTCRRYGVRA